MEDMTRRASVVLGLALLCAAGAAAQDPLRRDADGMLRKLEAIDARAKAPAAARRPPARTTITDREVNAYFKVYGPAFLPDGVVEPQVAIEDGGRVRAKSLVDLNAVRAAKPRGWLDPLAYVGGSVEVTAAGTLKTGDGRGQFALESATLGGVTVPKSLLQELVSYYSRSPELPNGVNLDQPFELPARIRTVETGRGAATVVQ
jgi:hypothetical protein